ncbi:MAG: YdcF family protein [Candidatus Eisenbacteria bacterium]
MAERRSHRRKFLRNLVLFVLFLVVIRLGTPILANAYGEWLVVGDDLVPADVAVALSGADGERLLAAIELYKAGTAKKILIVGPPVPILKVYSGDEGLTQGEAKRRIAIRRGVAEEDILVELRASSTYQEAETIRDVAAREGWEDVIVVTSPLHTRRARATLHKVLKGSGVTIQMHHLPLGRSSQNPKDWWHREAESVAVSTETFKMVFYAYEYRVFPWS